MILRLSILFCAVLLAASSALAEYRIGLATWSGYPESVQGFKDGLAEAGLVEGDIVRFFKGAIGADVNLQEAVAKEFKEAKLDLVYSLTTPGTMIVKDAMPDSTPIVFSIVTYPADSGLIDSFEYSGNNLVGTSNYVPIRHYLRILELVMPEAEKVAIFHRKGEPNSNIQTANMIRQLRRENKIGIQVPVRDLDDLEEKAIRLAPEVDVFMATTDTLMQAGGEDRLIAISLDKGVPILSANKKGIQNGSAFGPVVDFYALGKISGNQAAEILLNKIEPSQLETELQDAPLYLVNKLSLNKLNITLSPESRKRLTLFF